MENTITFSVTAYSLKSLGLNNIFPLSSPAHLLATKNDQQDLVFLDNLSTYCYFILMKTLGVGELKKHFSSILDDLRQGEEIGISFGKKHELVAVLVPAEKYYKKKKRKLGILQDKASFEMKENFKISDEELFDS